MELPKSYRPRLNLASSSAGGGSGPGGGGGAGPLQQGIILQYFASHHCAVCDTLSQKPICERCLGSPQRTACNLTVKIHQWDRVVQGIAKICRYVSAIHIPTNRKLLHSQNVHFSLKICMPERE